MKVALSLLILTALTLTQAEELSVFLARLETHPVVQASNALVRAAQGQLDSVTSPVALEASGGTARIAQQGFSLDDVDTGDLEIPPFIEDFFEQFEQPPGVATATQFSMGASFRPFVFGDIADLAEQGEIELRRALLSRRETLAELETQAVEAALGVQLAELGLRLAEEALALTESVEAATRTRVARGAGSQAELRDARRALRETQNGVLNATGELRVARQTLLGLVGEVVVPTLPELTRVHGLSPEVQRAGLDVALATLGVGNAERGLYPVAQASYNWNASNESTLSLSVESRTLQPSVSYSFQDPGRGFPETLTDSSFQIGVGVNFSGETFGAVDAAQAQRQAAEAGLLVARQQAEVRLLSLDNRFAQAERDHAFARLTLENALLTLQEAEAREQLGLAPPLERQQAVLAVQEARLNVAAAELEQTSSVLESYRAFATPLSEVLR